MSEKNVKEYYIKKKGKLLKTFEERLEIARELLSKKFDNLKVNEIINQIKLEYEQIIPEIPYIGGQKNPTTQVLIKCVSNLALFRILEKNGFSFNEIGEFHYHFSIGNHKIRKEALQKAGRDPSLYPFDTVYLDYQKKLTEATQKRMYSYDWVMDFVEGDGKSFAWGWDVYECGVQKVFKKLGDEKYLPLICLGDHYEAEALGFGFTRTKTLGFGASMCTHRFVKNYKTPRAWPPQKLKEFNAEFWNK